MHVNTPKTFVASAVISELQSSDIYLTVKARLFDLNANLNGVRVTAEFMNEIVLNESKYIGIPLYADVRGLINNKAIGHMYDSKTGEFHSTQIGSFYHYELDTNEDTTYLVGYARIPKGNKAVCQAIAELFASNELKFSFEISCGSYSVEEDGTFVIDADPKNFFEGEAIVTFPACEGAVATELVAELALEVESKGDENMEDAELKTTEVTAEETVETEEKTETAEAVVETVAETEEAKEPETVAEVKAEEPVAEVAETVEETAACGDEPKKEEAECECDPDEEPEEEPKEDATASIAAAINELKEQVKALCAEIENLKKQEEPVQVKAEQEPVQVNPFVAEISTPKKYSLLDREEKKTTTYSLLDRA